MLDRILLVEDELYPRRRGTAAHPFNELFRLGELGNNRTVARVAQTSDAAAGWCPLCAAVLEDNGTHATRIQLAADGRALRRPIPVDAAVAHKIVANVHPRLVLCNLEKYGAAGRVAPAQ